MPGTFPPPQPVSDPDMHHGTCVTHVPWCIPGCFLWSRWQGKRSRHSRRMRNPQFCVSGKRPMLCFEWRNYDSLTHIKNPPPDVQHQHRKFPSTFRLYTGIKQPHIISFVNQLFQRQAREISIIYNIRFTHFVVYLHFCWKIFIKHFYTSNPFRYDWS